MLRQFFKPDSWCLVTQASLGTPVPVALVVFDQAFKQRPIGGLLPLTADGGVDAKAIGIGCTAEAADHLRACHFGDVGCIQLRRSAMVACGFGLSDGLLVAGLIDRAQSIHATQNPVAALLAASGIDQWIERRGGFG